MPLSSRLLRTTAALCAAAVLPLAAAGCGGDEGDSGGDPASIAPARAPIYAEASLKLTDDVKELAKKLTGEEDPGGEIKRLIEKEARETMKDFDYSEDIEPWLGERAGVFIPSITAGGDEPPVGLILATKDVDKAREWIEAELRRGDEGEPKPQVVERTHKGTKYLVDTTDNEGAVFIDDFAVYGDDAALKLAIDARDGESLAENDEYGKARDAVEEDGAAFAYVRVSQIFSALGPQGDAFRDLFSGYGETFALGLDGDSDSIDMESAALGVSDDTPYPGPGEIITQLPASTWAAYGTADFGEQVERFIRQFAGAAAEGIGQTPDELFGQLEQQLGFDIREELGWIGDVGVFVFGDKLPELGGGLVAETTDPAATRRTLPRLRRLIEQSGEATVEQLDRGGVTEGFTVTSPQLPVPIHFALSDDDRFIVAVTDGALAQTLQPTDKLGDSQAWKDATGRLGDGMQTSFFVNFEPIPGLIEASGVGDDEPEFDRFLNGLKRLTTLAAGGKREGDVQRGRLVIGVK